MCRDSNESYTSKFKQAHDDNSIVIIKKKIKLEYKKIRSIKFKFKKKSGIIIK